MKIENNLNIVSILKSIDNRIDVLFESKTELPSLMELSMIELKNEINNYLQQGERV